MLFLVKCYSDSDYISTWIAVTEIIKLCPPETLVTLYKIPTFDSVDNFLSRVAAVRGKLKKGGILDNNAAARIVLRDWNEGLC